jgi:hypothetical protein
VKSTAKAAEVSTKIQKAVENRPPRGRQQGRNGKIYQIISHIEQSSFFSSKKIHFGYSKQE